MRLKTYYPTLWGYYDVEAFSRPYDLNSLCDLIPMDSSFIPQNE